MKALLNNWLFQTIIGNIIWIVLCSFSKKFKKFLKYIDETPTSNTSNKLYPKELLKKQFNISFKVSSVSSIVIFIMLINNIHSIYPYQILFLFLIVVVIFCYLFMLGAFEGATEYFDK